jgi:hypothetical protein
MGLANAQEYKLTRARLWLRKSWAGELVRTYRSCRREFRAWARADEWAHPNVDRLCESLAGLRTLAPDAVTGASDAEAPIFLLSTGWRTGSTLLQRILVTDPRLLLWGEPLGEMVLVSRITQMLSEFLSPLNLGLWKNQVPPGSSSMATSWIANLYPPGDDFRLAIRSLLDRWLGEPARQRGFVRWGFKEVRVGAAEAIMLHWLYPHSKFVIVSRHPYDCYRSFSDSKWRQVYTKYPEVPIDSATGFAKHWNRLAVSWSQLPVTFPVRHIKYEDLLMGEVDFRELEAWLGLKIRENVALSVSLGGTAARSQLSWPERLIIARKAAAGMHALGYGK